MCITKHFTSQSHYSPAVIKERAYVAEHYNNRSVAEQNSFDLAWELFMDPTFTDFRTAICATSAELLHFRQLVVNSVMATGKLYCHGRRTTHEQRSPTRCLLLVLPPQTLSIKNSRPYATLGGRKPLPRHLSMFRPLAKMDLPMKIGTRRFVMPSIARLPL